MCDIKLREMKAKERRRIKRMENKEKIKRSKRDEKLNICAGKLKEM